MNAENAPQMEGASTVVESVPSVTLTADMSTLRRVSRRKPPRTLIATDVNARADYYSADAASARRQLAAAINLMTPEMLVELAKDPAFSKPADLDALRLDYKAKMRAQARPVSEVAS